MANSLGGTCGRCGEKLRVYEHVCPAFKMPAYTPLEIPEDWEFNLPRIINIAEKEAEEVPGKASCRWCKGTGQVVLFTSSVPCKECGHG